MNTLISLSSLICFSNLLIYTLAASNETDRFALLQFKDKITNDPLQVFTSWNHSTHFCRWRGITCSSKHQRVSGLNLPSLKLEGTLSPYLANLSFLRQIDLKNNSFRDRIPREIGSLFRLRSLSLENNSFLGQLPENILNCTNLEHLRLGYNQLTGELPMEIGNLLKLKSFYINFNNLSGEIPSSLGNLTSLEILSASRNEFEGRIPASLSLLKKLSYMSFGANKLSGTIPPEIYNLSSLTFFHFGANQLEGTLPPDLGLLLPKLKVINLARNRFTGSIPASIANASNLMRLTLPLNSFTGNVPTMENLRNLQWVSISLNQLGNGEHSDDMGFLRSLINATSLQLVAFNGNNLGGELPLNIGNLSSHVNILSLDDNQLSGTVPSDIGKLTNLELLILNENKFTGQIPNTLGNLQKMKELLLSKNKCSGSIPSVLGNLTLLTRLSLERNNFQGTIPSSLGRCRNLLLLDLSHNNLTGTIPPEIFSLSSLSVYLDLYQNQLTGSLPVEVGNLVNLGGMDISYNNLSGEIPSSLGSCSRMEELLMRGNSFHGSIPRSLSSLRGLQHFDLSSNNLSGQIPTFLQELPFLQSLNLSFNNLEGQIPTNGVFGNATAVSLDSNDELCGGNPEFHLPTCRINNSSRKRSVPLKLLLPLIFGILLLAGMLSMIATLLLLRRRRKEPSIESPVLGSLMQLSYENLLKATDDFSENLIGSGGFGSVYKGILDQNNRMLVAVKVLNLQHRGASKSFIAECEALRNIRHRNLVKIISACASIDFHGNDFKALVYEIMDNGSLEDWLHPHTTTNEESMPPKILNLQQRLNIAIDVASALNYIHNDCETQIAHCDLKPSNILLDKNMVGHVGDFGLARFLQETTINGSKSSTGIRGSVGYTAPEYAMGGEVSTEGDVYSFGILLLELFTRKRPTDEMFKEGLNLHNLTKSALPERVTQVVDSTLLLQQAEGEMRANNAHIESNMSITKSIEVLIRVLEIGVACSADTPRERMPIADVESGLCSIREKLLKNKVRR